MHIWLIPILLILGNGYYYCMNDRYITNPDDYTDWKKGYRQKYSVRYSNTWNRVRGNSFFLYLTGTTWDLCVPTEGTDEDGDPKEVFVLYPASFTRWKYKR